MASSKPDPRRFLAICGSAPRSCRTAQTLVGHKACRLLRRQGLWLSLSLILLALSLGLLHRLGFPAATRVDRGEFNLIMQTPPATVPAVTDRLVHQAEQLLLRQPQVKHVSTEIRENLARLRVRLVPQDQRRVTTVDRVEKLRSTLPQYPRPIPIFNWNPGRVTIT